MTADPASATLATPTRPGRRGAVYVAGHGGGDVRDRPGSYNADATWNNAAPPG